MLEKHSNNGNDESDDDSFGHGRMFSTQKQRFFCIARTYFEVFVSVIYN